MAKHFFHGMETVLCKVVGVYTIGFQNRITNKRYMEQVVVMQNLFHERAITRVFDLKGSARSRYVRVDDEPTAAYQQQFFGETIQASSTDDEINSQSTGRW